jgi:predicted S18 family serine protease
VHALAQDTLDEAQDLVLYAQAVLGDASAQEATQRLAEAREHLGAGRDAAAVIEAVEAQTQASVAVQAVTGTVPDEVLEAAQQAAARAIASARNGGIEPMLSVSLVELAQDQDDPELALANLWTARTLALLDQVQAGIEPRIQPAPSLSPQVERVALAVVVGAILGAGLVAGLVLAVSASRRP